MYPMVNKLNLGDWKKMENSWADAMVEGKDVKVEVKANFDGESNRPSKLEVDYWINGAKETKSFNN
jgi:hypothetical protein